MSEWGKVPKEAFTDGRLSGRSVYTCAICGTQEPLEWDYQVIGACSDCVCRLANAYLVAHSDERYPEFCTDEKWNEILAESAARRASRYAKKPIPQGLRMKVFERDGFRCLKCGSQKDLQADHLHPERRGGAATLENLQTLCRSCNSRKGART